MTFYVENEDAFHMPFSMEALLREVAKKVLEEEKCPYEACVNLMLTDNAGIREYNRTYRNIDKETDVLSFPGVEFAEASDFSGLEDQMQDCFDPETGELMLGDMIISCEKAKEQAQEYGHSIRREIAFLIAHSMLHLCGYDHMDSKEADRMERKQEKVLTDLGITRDMK